MTIKITANVGNPDVFVESCLTEGCLVTVPAGSPFACNATGHTLAACYSFDAAEKVDVAGAVDPFFLDSSRNGIRAFAAAHSSPHLPWCVNMDDDGVLKLDDNVDFDWSNNEMWGYCSSKVRLPGVGFDYSETTMEQAAVHRLSSTAAVLEHYPGCGDIPLR